MPSSSSAEDRARGRGQRLLVALVTVIVAVPTGLLVLLYLAWPWLTVAVAGPLGSAIGAERLTLDAARPGLDRLVIERLELTRGRVELVVARGVLRYRLADLLTGRLASAELETVRLNVLPPDKAPDRVNGGAAPGIGPLLAVLPENGLIVQRLQTTVPALDFRAAGRLRADPRRLELELAGEAPAEARDFALQAVATPDGAFELRLAQADSADAPVLAVTGRAEAARLEVTGRIALDGLHWALAAHLAGLPPGDGSVSGTFQAEVPWPLPPRGHPVAGASGRLQGHWRPSNEELALDAAAAEWRLRDGVLSGQLRAIAGYRDLRLPVSVALAALRPEGSRLSARGTLRLAEDVAVPFVVAHRRDDGAGSLTAELAHRVEAPLGEALFQRWDADYDLTGGRIEAELALRWPAAGSALGGRARLRLAGVDGHYRDYRLAGLQGMVELRSSDEGAWSMPPARLHFGNVDVGIALRDIEATVGWSGDQVTVDALSLQLLGGRARIEPFAYRVAAGDAEFVIELARIDLAQVLALEGGHVSGSGVLDGRLPVQLRGGIASVAGGHVQAVPPGGVIRVAPALTAGTGQPGLDFALRALENFRYQRLAADVGYSGGGDLTLAVRLEGRNSEVEGGRPIHYNLTVTQNVPTLLRALRLQEQVTRRIEQQVRD